jgi:N utilization substance protein B
VKERRLARRLALDVLYEAEIRDMLPLEAFEKRAAEDWVLIGGDDESGHEGPSTDVVAYASELVSGVQSHHADIDLLIARYADRWTIERMPVIDRNLIRMGVFELLWRTDIPVPVAINEAVELAKSLSTDDSGRFVNGLLGRIAEQERPD